MKTTEPSIYLASKSPRRRELLRQLGIEPELMLLRDDPSRGAVDVDESALPGEAAHDYVARVTRAKAMAARHFMQVRELPVRAILTADTMVTVDGAILGKPANRAIALSMLRQLAGRSHDVLTSVALTVGDQVHQFTQRSSVTFAALSEQTMLGYCDSAEPYDKAGGYAIQGHAARFVRTLSGSYSGIMGLPLFETAQLLEQIGLLPGFPASAAALAPATAPSALAARKQAA
ncbi:MAG: Maf family protein [Janthinobacterium lividum]